MKDVEDVVYNYILRLVKYRLPSSIIRRLINRYIYSHKPRCWHSLRIFRLAVPDRKYTFIQRGITVSSENKVDIDARELSSFVVRLNEERCASNRHRRHGLSKRNDRQITQLIVKTYGIFPTINSASLSFTTDLSYPQVSH
jgi:hypothetical protein